MIDLVITGKTIAALRQQKGMSQQQLADLCSVTHQAVSKWENGLALPDIQTLLLISRHFGVAMEEILTGTLPNDPREPAQEMPEKPDNPADTQECNTDWEQIICMLPFASRETTEALILSALGESENKPPMSAVIAMLPFTSMETAEKLASAAWESCMPELLMAVAPFVSTRFLGDLVRRCDDIMQGDRMDVIQPLLPFLPGDIADELILKGAARPQSIRRHGKKGSMEYNVDLDFGRVGRSIGTMGRKIGKTFGNLFGGAEPESPSGKNAPAAQDPWKRIADIAIAGWDRELIQILADSVQDKEVLRLLLHEAEQRNDQELIDLITRHL